MSLYQHASERKSLIFEDLLAGRPPHEGEFDEQVLREATAKCKPQMGATRFEPQAILCEFIYPEEKGASRVLTVKLDVPERIVFLPVPGWVIENIWQGEVEGSYHFESEALQLLEGFRAELTSEGNRKWFEPQAAKRRG